MKLFPLETWGSAPALGEYGRTLTYAELAARVATAKAEFKNAGLVRSVVGLTARFSLQAIADFLALVELGNVIALAAPGQAHDFEIAGCSVIVGPGGITRRNADPPGICRQLLDSGKPGIIVFTSGSGGAPKASLHALEPLVERHLGGSPAMSTVLFMEMDHVGGLNTLFYALTRGGFALIPTSREAAEFFAEADREKVQLIPLTPSLLRLFFLLDEKPKFAALKAISYGAEVMPEDTLKKFHLLYPHVRLLQMYGATEFGMMPVQSAADDSLWVTLRGRAGYDWKVKDGMLYVKAPTAMLGYLNYEDPRGADGWMPTFDRVAVDGDRIRFLGREGDFVNVGGRKVAPQEVEDVLLSHPAVGDAAVGARPDLLLGQVLTATVSLSHGEPSVLELELKRLCASRLEPFKVPVDFRFEPLRYSQRGKKER